jgi:hypothetical protein
VGITHILKNLPENYGSATYDFMINHLVNRFQQVVALTRAKEWWSFKLAPILGTTYATAAISDTSLISLWASVLFILLSLGNGASYANILNNWSDQEEDRLSSKPNFMLGRSHLFVAFVLTACILPGLIISGLLIQAPLVLGVYLTNWLVFAAYSLPPLRFKERGFLGVLAIAVGEDLLPQTFAVLLIIHDARKNLPEVWLVFIVIWALASGLRSILWHQILDFENDNRAGVNTFAVKTSPITLQKLGKWIIFPIEVTALIGLLLISQNPLAWVFLGLYLTTEFLRYYFWQITIVLVAPCHNHRLILVEYYDVFYPLGFLGLAVWKNPGNLIILLGHLLLFFPRIWWWIRDIWGLVRWEIPNKIQNPNPTKSI